MGKRAEFQVLGGYMTKVQATPDQRETLPTQQRRVLEFIEEFIEISGYPPSISEIGEHLGVSSTFGVRKHVDALVKKGLIQRGGAGLSRAIRPSARADRNWIPVVGRVTA